MSLSLISESFYVYLLNHQYTNRHRGERTVCLNLYNLTVLHIHTLYTKHRLFFPILLPDLAPKFKQSKRIYAKRDKNITELNSMLFPKKCNT